jgi:hypothetical protein
VRVWLPQVGASGSSAFAAAAPTYFERRVDVTIRVVDWEPNSDVERQKRELRATQNLLILDDS